MGCVVVAEGGRGAETGADRRSCRRSAPWGDHSLLLLLIRRRVLLVLVDHEVAHQEQDADDTDDDADPRLIGISPGQHLELNAELGQEKRAETQDDEKNTEGTHPFTFLRK